MKTKKLLSILCLGALLVGCGCEPGSVPTTTTTTPTTSAPTSYAITVNENIADAGEVTLSSETATAGTEVTVTVTVAEDYSLESVTSSDATLTPTSETVYTFTMPEKAVAIDVNYVALYEILGITNETYCEVSLTSLSIGDKLTAGTHTIDFTIVSEYDSVDDIVYYYAIYISGKEYDLIVDENDDTLFHITAEITADFVIYFEAASTMDENGYTVSFTDGEHYEIVGIVNEAKYSEITFAVYTTVGYTITDCYYVNEGSTEHLEFESYNNIYWLYEFTANITIYVEVEFVGAYNVNYVGADKIDGSDKFPTYLTAGDSVEFNVDPVYGYYVKNITLETSDPDAQFDELGTKYLFFTMPKADLTITFETAESIPVAIAANPNVLDVKFYSDYELSKEVAGVNPGSQTYIGVTVADGYAISDITGTVAGSEDNVVLFNSYSGSYYISSSVESPVTLVITTAEAATVTLDGGEFATATISGTTSNTGSFLEGETVKFNIKCADGYEVESVTCSDSTVVPEYISYEGYWAFEMPADDITITVTVCEINFITVIIEELPEYVDTNIFSVSGEESDGYLEAAGSCSEFIAGELICMYLYTTTGAVDYQPVLVYGDTQVEFDYNYGWTVILPTDVDSVKIEFIATYNDPITVNVVNEGNYDVTFSVNGSDDEVTAEELPTLYPGDSIYVVTPETDGTERYVVTFTTESYGEEEQYSGILSENTTITITKVAVQFYSVTVLNNATSATSEDIADVIYSVNYSPYEVTFYVPGEPYSVAELTQIMVEYNGDDSTRGFECKITVAGEVIYDSATVTGWDAGWIYTSFELTGDAVIEFYDKPVVTTPAE